MAKFFFLSIFATLMSCNLAKVPQKQKGNLPLASQWIIEVFNDKTDKVPVTKNSYFTIQEDLKSFSGNGGCNSMSGSLKVKDDFIHFSDIMITEMACEHLAQEQIFMENLQKVNKYEIKGGELFLYQDNTLIMTMESFR